VHEISPSDFQFNLADSVALYRPTLLTAQFRKKTRQPKEMCPADGVAGKTYALFSAGAF
jgi:hypothetical protein